jgi:DHA1 family bicyclomycin/chloramphenicol resistance-like MFS transporter
LLVGYRVLLPETNSRARRATRARTSVLADYRSALSSRTFVSYALVMGLMFSGQLVFISTSAFVLIEELGLDERVYGFSFAFVAGGLMAGAWTSSRLVGRLPSRRVVILGASVAASASAVLAAAAWLAPPSLPGLLLPMVFVAVGLGITRPSAMAAALIEFPQMAGLASAVLGFTQMLVASSLNIVYGALVEPGTRALASGVCFAMFAGLATILALRPPNRAAVATAAPALEAAPRPRD